MGSPIDGVFADREAFADFFTRYYTDYEPECALVAEEIATGRVVGYLLGSVRYRYQALMQVWLFLTRFTPRVLWRLLSGQYDSQSRRFLAWVVFRAARETPPAPNCSAHFHINLLANHRDGHSSRRMIFGFVELARSRGVRGVYGQIQTYPGRRTVFWERYGFRELDRRRITKFDAFHADPVYVTTLFLEFGRD